MAKTKVAAGTIEAFLRTNPGPMFSDVSPQRVFQDAYALYVATCAEPVELGVFIDHLWGRGLTVEVVGTRYWLRLPGKLADYEVRNTPTRING